MEVPAAHLISGSDQGSLVNGTTRFAASRENGNGGPSFNSVALIVGLSCGVAVPVIVMVLVLVALRRRRENPAVRYRPVQPVQQVQVYL